MLQLEGLITLDDIGVEFNGLHPFKLGQFYGATEHIPTEGILKFSHFYGVPGQDRLTNIPKTYKVFEGQSTLITFSNIMFGVYDIEDPALEFLIVEIVQPIHGTIVVGDSYVIFTSTGPAGINGSYDVRITDPEGSIMMFKVNMHVVEEDIDEHHCCFIDKELAIKTRSLRITPTLRCQILTGTVGDYDHLPKIHK